VKGLGTGDPASHALPAIFEKGQREGEDRTDKKKRRRGKKRKTRDRIVAKLEMTQVHSSISSKECVG